jgi:CHAT domain-containing protein
LDIVHLAVHGRGDARQGGQARLLFADAQWVSFDVLAELNWHTRLVIFSGCGTGIAGPRHGNELVGVARAAAEAGAVSVLATLWPVDDEMTYHFMVAFHQELRNRWNDPEIDLLAALDTARTALRGQLPTTGTKPRARNGRDIQLDPSLVPTPAVDRDTEELLTWAPFVLFGDPVLSRANTTGRLIES